MVLSYGCILEREIRLAEVFWVYFCICHNRSGERKENCWQACHFLSTFSISTLLLRCTFQAQHSFWSSPSECQCFCQCVLVSAGLSAVISYNRPRLNQRTVCTVRWHLNDFFSHYCDGGCSARLFLFLLLHLLPAVLPHVVHPVCHKTSSGLMEHLTLSATFLNQCTPPC